LKILITGVNGFIATNMVEYYLSNTNHQVIGLSKVTHATYANKPLLELAKTNKNFRYLQCDITDINKLFSILKTENPDQIIHLAAEADVSRSFEYPTDFLHTNVYGTFNLLEWVRENKVRMLHFSTDEVFGEPDHRSREEERLHPKNPYSASKASAEEFIRAYNHAFDTEVQVVRPVNNFGPYQGTNRLIAKTILRCLSNEPFYLFAETQKHKRWWIYTEDTCRAVDFIIKNGDKQGIYNITSEIELGVEETVFKILDIFGKRDLFKGYTEVRPKDDENYALDGKKLRDLGWTPKYSFEEGMEKTIDWYTKNMAWFEKR
jgi:dTDP-glucose 4,6-dehydratase